jgi:chromosome segregation ATPase
LDGNFCNLEHELTITKDHLQATNEEMEEMRIQMEEMGVEMEKLHSDITCYQYNNTELRNRLAKKDEIFCELNDHLFNVEGDLEYIFK